MPRVARPRAWHPPPLLDGAQKRLLGLLSASGGAFPQKPVILGSFPGINAYIFRSVRLNKHLYFWSIRLNKHLHHVQVVLIR